MSAFGQHEKTVREITHLKELIEEQKGTITALNMALGGEDSTSTENLIDAHEVDYEEQGLIALCRKLTAENVRLSDKLEASGYSPISEEVEDILRSEIIKKDTQLSRLKGVVAAYRQLLVEVRLEAVASKDWYIKQGRYNSASIEAAKADRYDLALTAIKEEGL